MKNLKCVLFSMFMCLILSAPAFSQDQEVTFPEVTPNSSSTRDFEQSAYFRNSLLLRPENGLGEYVLFIDDEELSIAIEQASLSIKDVYGVSMREIDLSQQAQLIFSVRLNDGRHFEEIECSSMSINYGLRYDDLKITSCLHDEFDEEVLLFDIYNNRGTSVRMPDGSKTWGAGIVLSLDRENYDFNAGVAIFRSDDVVLQNHSLRWPDLRNNTLLLPLIKKTTFVFENLLNPELAPLLKQLLGKKEEMEKTRNLRREQKN